MQRELEKLEDLFRSGFIFQEDYEARKTELYARFEQEVDLSSSGSKCTNKSAYDPETEFNK